MQRAENHDPEEVARLAISGNSPTVTVSAVEARIATRRP